MLNGRGMFRVDAALPPLSPPLARKPHVTVFTDFVFVALGIDEITSRVIIELIIITVNRVGLNHESEPVESEERQARSHSIRSSQRSSLLFQCIVDHDSWCI